MLLTILKSLLRALSNTFTLLVAALSTALWLGGLHGDALFLLSTLTINTAVGTFQEIRAKALLKKLELLNSPTATVVRGDHVEVMKTSHLSVGDHVSITRGDQVPADGILLKADGLFVNESLLTGEADEVQLYVHHPVYAGSFAVSGTGIFRVTALGAATRAGSMTATLQWYDAKLTPLQRTIGRIIRWLTYCAILLGLAIYIEGAYSGTPIPEILSVVASGALSIVPEGLLLASTLLFAYGCLRMAAYNVLVRRIGAIEGLSRLNILCLDKTGTLTENSLKLETVRREEPYSDASVRLYLAALLSADTSSPTTDALSEYRPATAVTLFDTIPFTSSKKFSAVLFPEGSLHRAVLLGAPEAVEDTCVLTADQRNYLNAQTRSGNRVLLLADFGLTRTALSAAIRKSGTVVAFIVLKHTLRPDAADTVFYLQANKVVLKVISGDAKETVQAVARLVGIRNWRAALTGDQLAELDSEQWERMVPKTTVFSRVLPEQKERIVATLRTHGYTGMVGDGVNDTLALKRADVGISFKEASQAARQVADVILLDNSFAAIPTGMRIGAQIILGVQMVACLFFNKIAVGVTVLALSYILDIPYPLTTRYLFLINILTIGLPTLMWSLAPARPSSRPTGSGWLRPVLGFSTVNGCVTGIAIMAAYSVATHLPGPSFGPDSVALFVALILGVVTVWLIPRFMGAVYDRTLQLYPLLYSLGALAVLILLGRGTLIGELFLVARLDLLHSLAILGAAGAGAAALISLSLHRKHYVIAEK